MRWLFAAAILGAAAVGAVLVGPGCAPRADRPTRPPPPPPSARRGVVPFAHDADLPDVAGPVEPDGANDGALPAIGPGLRALVTAPSATFVAQEPPPSSAHALACDIAPLAGRLYVAHAARPVVEAGAAIHRFDPTAAAGARWSVAFDWSGAAPGREYGRGAQGFTRVRVIDGRLLVPDTDTPGPGFGLSDAPFEEYVFASDERGEFAPAGAGGEPPAGTVVVPNSFHNFDVIRYRGSLIVSVGTGVIAPGQWGPFPAGLAVGDLERPRWPVRFEPGSGTRTGVLRATFMHRFKGRLYMGFQNNERRARWDAAIFSGDPAEPNAREPVLVRITGRGGWLTHRWASGDGVLYWIGAKAGRGRRRAVLYRSDDGQRFRKVQLPRGAGRPQDLLVIDGTRYLLTDRALFRSRAAEGGWERLADAPAEDPFGVFNGFCSAPLVAVGDALYAGGLRRGQLFRVVVPAVSSTR